MLLLRPLLLNLEQTTESLAGGAWSSQISAFHDRIL